MYFEYKGYKVSVEKIVKNVYMCYYFKPNDKHEYGKQVESKDILKAAKIIKTMINKHEL